MKKIVVGLLIVALAIGAFFAFNNFIYDQKQGDGNPPAPYAATLRGTYVCLPHRDTSGPQTMECAFGLQTEVGEYYALDFGEDGDMTQFKSGEEAFLTGTITPIEALSTDQWQKYDIVGILSVSETQ